MCCCAPVLWKTWAASVSPEIMQGCFAVMVAFAVSVVNNVLEVMSPSFLRSSWRKWSMSSMLLFFIATQCFKVLVIAHEAWYYWLWCDWY